MSERPAQWGQLPPHGTVLTTAEYLQTAESMRVQELIYGTLRVEESPLFRHQNLLLELAVLMRVFVGRKAAEEGPWRPSQHAIVE